MTEELRAGCFVLRLVANGSGLPRAGSPTYDLNCDGTIQRFQRNSGMGFAPTVHSPAYEWTWVRDCEHEGAK